MAAFANSFFQTFSVVQLLAVLLLTPAMMAGAIAQERERRTIEYLFASSLTNAEIIMSKFLARTIHVASLLVVGLPLLAIAMLLGGVDPQLLLIVFVVTVTTLVAMAVVVDRHQRMVKRSRDAVARSYAFTLLFLIVPAMLSVLQATPWPLVANGWQDRRAATVGKSVLRAVDLEHDALFRGATMSAWSVVWPMLAELLGFFRDRARMVYLDDSLGVSAEC